MIAQLHFAAMPAQDINIIDELAHQLAFWKRQGGKVYLSEFGRLRHGLPSRNK
jgi:hypothetical protein